MASQITKNELRVRAKRNRAGLAVDHGRIGEALRRFEPQIADGWIVVFDALEGEPDLSGWIETSERSFALTRTPESGRTLSVHPRTSDLEVHPYGYRQPVASAPVIPDAEIAAVLVPGLAFDLRGGRIGWGAGYYDRLLARLSAAARTTTRPIFVGVSDGFIVSSVPMDDHDVPMTHLATESGVRALPVVGQR